MNNCVFDNGKKCIALSEKHCEGCKFYKTEEELNKARQKAKERIRSLPISVHSYIALKYYGGLLLDND